MESSAVAAGVHQKPETNASLGALPVASGAGQASVRLLHNVDAGACYMCCICMKKCCEAALRLLQCVLPTRTRLLVIKALIEVGNATSCFAATSCFELMRAHMELSQSSS